MDMAVDTLQQTVQSLELMKIVLHVTLAGIFYKRGLLPLIAFGERSLSISRPSTRHQCQIRTYDDFVRGETSQTDAPTFQVKMMERGVDSQTDRVLDLLEESIFDVLVRRRLQAVKFAIVKKAEQPIEVVESYTVSFAYHSESTNVDQLASNRHPKANTTKEEPNSNLTTPRSPVDIMKGIKQIDRLLIPLTATFTKLPSVRALGIFLFYTDDCPKAYQAPDFVDASDFVFQSVSEEEQVTVRKVNCGGISTVRTSK